MGGGGVRVHRVWGSTDAWKMRIGFWGCIRFLENLGGDLGFVDNENTEL